MDDCLFYQNHEENLFVSFSSMKYYRHNLYDLFLGIKGNGRIKSGRNTLPGQDSVQFVAFNPS